VKERSLASARIMLARSNTLVSECRNPPRLISAYFRFAVCVCVSLFLFGGCGLNVLNEQRARLKPLLDRKVDRQGVIDSLGTRYVDYSLGHTNRGDLMKFLSREPSDRLIGVRERVGKWPHVLLYSTPDMMTWIFFDEQNRIVDYVVTTQ